MIFWWASPVFPRVLELASGHGVPEFAGCLEDRPDLRLQGLDISPPAVAVAKRLLLCPAMAAREFRSQRRFETRPGRGASELARALLPPCWRTSGDPRALFALIASRLAADGMAFFSTALESAQRDHIYEFHYESEPLKMAEEAGLRVSKLVCDGGNPVPADISSRVHWPWCCDEVVRQEVWLSNEYESSSR